MASDDLKFKAGDLKKLKDGFLAERLRRNGYVLKKWLTLLPLFVGVIILAYLFYQDGMSLKNNVNIICPEEQFLGCSNPYYINCNPIRMGCIPEQARTVYCTTHMDLCIMETLPPGFMYGSSPSGMYSNFWIILISLIIVCYGLNHMIYNKPEQREVRKKNLEKTK